MSDVAWILGDTIRWPQMEEDILHALGENTEEEFSAFLARVEGRFRATPRLSAVLRFMRDHSKFRDEELGSLFEFIYSSLINNLKGASLRALGCRMKYGGTFTCEFDRDRIELRWRNRIEHLCQAIARLRVIGGGESRDAPEE